MTICYCHITRSHKIRLTANKRAMSLNTNYLLPLARSHYLGSTVLWIPLLQYSVSWSSAPDSWTRSQKLLSSDTKWHDWPGWNTHIPGHISRRDLRCDPIIILLSCPPARTVIVAWALTTHCQYQENIGLSKLNRMKNLGSRWKAWHWNVVGSWRGCWWIWINITPGPVSTTALTWGMRLGVMEAHCDFF